MEAIKIINAWINQAHEKKLYPFIKHFWIIRDLLEGLLHPETTLFNETYIFLKNECKESDERNLLIDELNKIFIKRQKEEKAEYTDQDLF